MTDDLEPLDVISEWRKLRERVGLDPGLFGRMPDAIGVCLDCQADRHDEHASDLYVVGRNGFCRTHANARLKVARRENG
ncbi:MAG: hypothetical protein IT175_06065 [Acidobacteria bacterium]|nr:hypothetical protein [Acidobacteriota bacterium]